jgi:hypothetical protein
MSDQDAISDPDEEPGLGEVLRRSHGDSGGSGLDDSAAPGGAVVGQPGLGTGPIGGGDPGGDADLGPEADSDDSRPVAGG